MGGSEFIIGGVKVDFPVKPYRSQMAMMGQIMRGLKRKENCLLESPTGSGKSLALLCSTLAWQKLETERISAHNDLIMQGITDPDILSRVANGTPVSRSETSSASRHPIADYRVVDPDHEGGFLRDENFLNDSTGDETMNLNTNDSAFEGVIDNDGMAAYVNQLGNRPQRIKLPKIFFGTRTHKQLHQIIRELRSTKYKHVKNLVLGSREHTCIHPVVSTEKNKTERCKQLRDNVDNEFCNFYHGASHIKGFGDLHNKKFTGVFDIEDLVKFGKKQKACPYYITRHLMEEAEIVFCPYNYLTDPLIREAMMLNLKDHVIVLDEAHNIEDSSRDAASASLTQDDFIDAQKDLERLMSHFIHPAACDTLINMIHGLTMWMDSYINNLTDYQEYGRSGKIFNGIDMIKQLKAIDIHPGRLKELQGCLSDLTEEEVDKEEKKPKPNSGTCVVLKNLFLVLNFIFKDNHAQDYQIALIKEQEFGRFKKSTKDIDGWLGRSKSIATFKYTLNFWCLNPGVAFSEVGELARSVILTSGTLSPMNSFESELQVKFPIQMEVDHVIKGDQVWIGTLSRGPKNVTLNGTYRHSETWDFQDELGRSILEICKSVPRGVLCFLPSYSMMNKLIERWQSTTLWSDLEKYKFVISEKRRAEEFEEAMREFKVSLEVTKNYKEDEPNGVLFFAVCRGKVSEGMDFSDDNARAVITVGIPYPNVKDIQVDLKKKYNNIHCKKQGLLTGNEWYEIQAFRALNQALGRCLRHRYDWGALILIDERFQYGCLSGTTENKYTKALSKWIRKSLYHHRDFNGAIRQIKNFSEDMTENPPQNRDIEISKLTISNSQESTEGAKSEILIIKKEDLDVSIVGGIGIDNDIRGNLEASALGPSQFYLKNASRTLLTSTQICGNSVTNLENVDSKSTGESLKKMSQDAFELDLELPNNFLGKSKKSKKCKTSSKNTMESYLKMNTNCEKWNPEINENSKDSSNSSHKKRKKCPNIEDDSKAASNDIEKDASIVSNNRDSEYSVDEDLFEDTCNETVLNENLNMHDLPSHSTPAATKGKNSRSKMTFKNTPLPKDLDCSVVTVSDESDMDDFQQSDVSFSAQSAKKSKKSKKRKGIAFTEYD